MSASSDDVWDTDIDGQPWEVMPDGRHRLRDEFEEGFRCGACAWVGHPLAFGSKPACPRCGALKPIIAARYMGRDYKRASGGVLRRA